MFRFYNDIDVCAQSWFSKTGTALPTDLFTVFQLSKDLLGSQSGRQTACCSLDLTVTRPKINRERQITESSLRCYSTHLQISNYSKQKLIGLKTYSCRKISPGVVTKRRYWFSQLILSRATSVWEQLSLVDVLCVVPTNEAATMSKPGIARSNK